MIQVSFTPNLLRHVDIPDADVHGATVGEALDAYFASNPRVRGYVLDEQGTVRKHVAIFINDTLIRDRQRLSDPVAADDAIFVMQALSGG